MLIIDAETVRTLYTMDRAIAAMRLAFVRLAEGQVTQPPRLMAALSRQNTLALMPAEVIGESLGVKLVTIFPGNVAAQRSPHSLLVTMFDANDGRLTSIIDGAELTAIRTAATSAVATDLLARPDSTTLAVLGAGVQARAHLRAMAAVRPIATARVWSRRPERAAEVATWAAAELDLDCRPAPDPATAMAGADILCTATASSEPIVTAAMLGPGIHINAVGASFPSHRELSGAAVAAASVFVDSHEAARREAGDLVLAAADGNFDLDRIRGELGDLLLDRCAGRRSDLEITLFKSVGAAIQDVQSGAAVEALARSAGAAVVEIPIGA
ncbi:ornithine cyclodeaminase family protein [Actinocrispum wychmicini]|uniref:Ornithine cyclodeaminase n=1 Tax=Actinocrispum wychmicini TaxID=1213861 RepID=A0A4R2JM51_9PSEU|nr:ornithine cyclodeaminase family protein [Actinocrispum wychmicini]TCO61173.1 ornithine cyclodeaminase [Actinocrispum wychmicini]